MKSKLMRKAAEMKSALVSKEAAMSSTEIVLLILFVVIIAVLVGVAIRNIVVGADGNGGVLKKVGDKIDAVADTGAGLTV
ncbi:MAG: hypothetical protein ACI37Z_10525 [Candidatus Gastranaerophilaceae bacterium]